MRSALPLRQLLLDGDKRLIDQVNRERRLKIWFTINDRPPMWEQVSGLPMPDIWSLQDGLDPATAVAGSMPKDVAADGFLAKVVMIAGGKRYAVKDIISYVAHVLGGVHAGKPADERQAALAELSGTLFVGGQDAALRQLQSIARVTLRALAPLVEAIKGEGDRV